MTRRRNDSMFSSELQLEDYLVAHPKLLNFVVVRQGPMTLRNGWLDILGIDEHATLENAELKYLSTCGNTMSQLLDYAHWMQPLTMDEIVDLAAQGENPIDLPAVFEERFGKPLPKHLGGRPRTTVIARRFDRRTIHGIEYLQREGVPIRALRWVESAGSVQLRPFSITDHELQELQHQRELLERRLERAKRKTAKREVVQWTPKRFKVQGDVADFWKLHSHRFVWDFVPSGLVFALYEEWQESEGIQGVTRKPFARSHLVRHMNHLVYETGGWRYLRNFRADARMDGHEPFADGLAWKKPDPGAYVPGYLRSAL